MRKTKKSTERDRIVPLEGKTDNQRDYIDTIRENSIVACSGPAGCGKSFIASGMAAHMLTDGEIKQIIISRPLVCTGTSIGSLPGELSDKIAPYFLPMKDNLKYFLTQAHYGHYEGIGSIQYRPVEVMRGATFDNACMILDEAQNCTIEQITMFISRMGKNTKVLINGDVRQNDLRGKSGLATVMDKICDIEGCGVCYLDYEDIQRNGLLGRVLLALES